MKPYETANAVAVIVMKISAPIRRWRLSRMSARAPAGSAKRNRGRFDATCTSATITGSASSVVMSQPELELYIQLPMLAISVAVQMTENVLCRNGLHGEETRFVGLSRFMHLREV